MSVYTSVSTPPDVDSSLEGVAAPTVLAIVKDQVCQKTMWMFIAIVVVVLLILFYIAKPSAGWFKDLKKYSWGDNSTVLSVIMCIVVVFMAYSTYLAYSVATEAARAWILMSFVAAMALLVVWFAMFYRSKDIINSFYVGMAFLFVSFAQTYFVWQSHRQAGYGMIPYLLWAAAAVALCWDIGSENGHLD